MKQNAPKHLRMYPFANADNWRARRASFLVCLVLILLSPISETRQTGTPRALATLNGRVTDSETGLVVGGAQITVKRGRATKDDPHELVVLESKATTDLKGHFRIDFHALGEYTIVVSAPGYLRSSLYVLDIEDPAVRDLVVKLEPLQTISGRVVDGTGRGIHGARVMAPLGSIEPSVIASRLLDEGGSERLVGICDTDGRFRISVPITSRSLSLVAEAGGYVPVARSLDLSAMPPRRNTVLIHLSVGLVARGRVLESRGTPVSNAIIKAARVQTQNNPLGAQEISQQAVSGADGIFTLRGLIEGTYTLTINHNAYATLTIPEVAVRSPTQQLEPAVMQPQAKIAGRVIDELGHPIAGAKIGARREGEDGRSLAQSAVDGSFLFAQFFADSKVLLYAEANGYVPTHKVVWAPDSGAVLVLSHRGTVRGRVEDVDTGLPLTVFKIWLVNGSEQVEFHGEDGSFEWSALNSGRWTIAAQASGYQAMRIPNVEVHSGGVTDDLIFRLTKGVSLTGRVVDDESGEPLSDATVMYYEQGDGESVGRRFNRTTQVTDSDGRFRFDGLPRKPVTVSVLSPSYAPAEMTLEPEEGALIEIRMQTGGSLSGRVVARGASEPLGAASVSLFNEVTGEGTNSLSDATGSFSFEHLAAGTYRVKAESDSGQSSSLEVGLTKNEQAQGIVLIIEGGATISGRITGTLATEGKVVNLVVRGPGAFTAMSATDPEGRYEIRGIPSGEVNVMATTSRFRSVSRSIVIPDGLKEQILDIDLPQLASLHGRVTRAGRPLPFVYVSAAPTVSGMVRAITRTNEDGDYELLGLSDGTYLVSVPGVGTTTIGIAGSAVLNFSPN